MSNGEKQQTPPRVFISYAQYEPAHSERVLALALALAADGLDVELDQFHGHETINWPRWCDERLRPESTDFVLMVCSAEYRRRIEGRVERDQGRGVFWEGDLIYGYLYRAKANERFVPLLLDDEPEGSLPPVVANWNHFRLRDFGLQSADQGYEDLYRLLTDQPAPLKPERGALVRLPPRSAPSIERARPTRTPVNLPYLMPPRVNKVWWPAGEEKRLNEDNTPVNCVVFSRDGKLFVSGSGGDATPWINPLIAVKANTLRVWRVSDGACLRTLKHPKPVTTVTISSDGHCLASGSSDGLVRIWHIPKSDPVRISEKPKWVFDNHTLVVNSVAFARNGSVLASASSDETVRLWRVRTGRLLQTLDMDKELGEAHALCFSPQGEEVLTIGSETGVRLFRVLKSGRLADENSSQSVPFVKEGVPLGKEIKCLSFSPDGQMLAWVRQWGMSIHADVLMWRWSTAEENRPSTLEEKSTERGKPETVVFAPNSNVVAIGYSTGDIRLLRISDKEELQLWKGHNGQVNSLSFSPDRHWLVSGSDDATICLWPLRWE